MNHFAPNDIKYLKIRNKIPLRTTWEIKGESRICLSVGNLRKGLAHAGGTISAERVARKEPPSYFTVQGICIL